MKRKGELLDMEKMKWLEGETIAIPPSDPMVTQSGSDFLIRGVDSAAKVFFIAIGNLPFPSNLLNMDRLKQLNLTETNLVGLYSFSTDLHTRKGSNVPEKEKLRLVLSLAHYLVKEDKAEKVNYINSPNYWRDSIELFLEKMDLGPLIPAQEIPAHLRQLKAIANHQNRKMGVPVLCG